MKRKSKGKTLRVRCWIDIDGERFFGPGRAELLQLIHETGSISSAARSMGMSYKKAWAMVDGMNTQGKRPYVVAQKGGQEGGGTYLTPAGLKMLAAYQTLDLQLDRLIDKHAAILKLV